MNKLLKVDHLSIEVRTPLGWQVVVQDLSFTVEQGQIVGLIGESGSGKSLSALAIARLLPHSARVRSGTVRFKNESVLELNEKEFSKKLRGQEITFIFQNPMTSLNPVLKIGEQMTDGYRIKYPHISKREAKEQALDLLDQMGIQDPLRVFEEYPHRLSGGMLQRIVIAAAMICKPSLLIADEPTTALDVRVQAQILNLLARLKERHHLSVLLISHDLGVIGQMCDRILVMYAGRGVETAPQAELFEHPAHPYTKALLEATPSLAGNLRDLQEIPGSIPSVPFSVSDCIFHPRCSHKTEQCLQSVPVIQTLDSRKQLAEHQVACHYPLARNEVKTG